MSKKYAFLQTCDLGVWNAAFEPEKFKLFKKMTPGQRRMFVCYLWNSGEKLPAAAETVTWQLNWYRQRFIAAEAEGVVLHANTLAVLDMDACNAAIERMDEHGEEDMETTCQPNI